LEPVENPGGRHDGGAKATTSAGPTEIASETGEGAESPLDLVEPGELSLLDLVGVVAGAVPVLDPDDLESSTRWCRSSV
jgi:hypothetical protein